MNYLYASKSGRKKYWINELLFVGPIFLSFVVIKVIPLFLSFGYSLTEWNGISSVVKYSGVDNYLKVAGDGQYWSSFWWTIKFAAVSLVLSNILGMALAKILLEPLKFRNVMRAGFYLSNTIGGLVLGFVWRFIFVDAFSLLGKVTGLGLFRLPWLASEQTSFWAMVIVQVWVLSGYLMLLYIAGFSTVPAGLMEAARIDGANGRQTFWKVTIPLIMPTITRCLFLSFLTCMRVYDLNLALTQGGPFRSSESITFNVFQTAFSENQMGYGCAKAVLFIIIVVIISIMQVRMTSKYEVNI